MNSIPQKKKKLSLILKIIVIVSAFVGTAISAYGDGTSFMNGVQTFMYFTTQSNIAIAIICAVGYYKMSQVKGKALTVSQCKGEKNGIQIYKRKF